MCILCTRQGGLGPGLHYQHHKRHKKTTAATKAKSMPCFSPSSTVVMGQLLCLQLELLSMHSTSEVNVENHSEIPLESHSSLFPLKTELEQSIMVNMKLS